MRTLDDFYKNLTWLLLLWQAAEETAEELDTAQDASREEVLQQEAMARLLATPSMILWTWYRSSPATPPATMPVKEVPLSRRG